MNITSIYIKRDNPYPGLRPFYSNEADIFFGREEQVDKLMQKLKRSRFLAVVGASGSGKSSLVRAGLIPALESGFNVDVGAQWEIVQMRPGIDPYESLTDALIKLFKGAADMDEIQSELKRSPKGLQNVLARLNAPDDENFMILVDQFEELFRYIENNNFDAVASFINLLIYSSKQKEISIHIVITMRSDFINDCSMFYGLPEMLNDNQFLTPRLTRSQCEETIVEPAKRAGASVEPALVSAILNDMGPDQDQLPLLQNVLMRMCLLKKKNGISPINLTLKDYEEAGGLNNSLSMQANEIYDKMSKKDQRIVKFLFTRLATGSEKKDDVRKPTMIKEIAEIAGVTPKEVIEVANCFRVPECNFITPAATVDLTESSYIDISHESLIRKWDKLAEWASKESESAKVYKRLCEAAEFYKNDKGDLLSERELKVGLYWYEKRKPTATWAARYGGNFEEAMDFFHKSDKTYRKKTRIINSLKIGLPLLALTFLCLILYNSSIKNFERNLERFKANYEAGKHPEAYGNLTEMKKNLLVSVFSYQNNLVEEYTNRFYLHFIGDQILYNKNGLYVSSSTNSKLFTVYRFSEKDIIDTIFNVPLDTLILDNIINGPVVSKAGDYLWFIKDKGHTFKLSYIQTEKLGFSKETHVADLKIPTAFISHNVENQDQYLVFLRGEKLYRRKLDTGTEEPIYVFQSEPDNLNFFTGGLNDLAQAAIITSKVSADNEHLYDSLIIINVIDKKVISQNGLRSETASAEIEKIIKEENKKYKNENSPYDHNLSSIPHEDIRILRQKVGELGSEKITMHFNGNLVKEVPIPEEYAILRTLKKNGRSFIEFVERKTNLHGTMVVNARMFEPDFYEQLIVSKDKY